MRSEQLRKPAERYRLSDFCFTLYTIDEEPNSVKEEVESTNGKLWKDIMVKEMKYLYKNETWDMVKLPNGRKPFSSNWVFKKKLNAASQVKKL
jgi:hypothetical protein